VKIALTQMNINWDSQEVNTRLAENLTIAAKKSGAEMIIFPEMTLTGFNLNTTQLPDDKGNFFKDFFSNLAKNNCINIVAGGVINNNKTYENCAISFSNQGEIMSTYSKIHLFSYANEHKIFNSGNRLSYFTLNGISFGLTICYDLRFPALSTALSNNSHCIINIANWPDTRVMHWKALLKARAIENQIYTIGVNRVGLDGKGLKYPYSSVAFDPDGNKLTEENESNNLILIEIFKKVVETQRATFPFRKDLKNID